MKKSGVIRFMVLCLASAFILSLAAGSNAQSKKDKGGKASGKGKKVEKELKEDSITTEAGVDSLKTGRSRHSGKQMKEEQEEKKSGPGHRATGRKDDGYRPKKLKKNEHSEWETGSPPGWSRGKKTGWEGAGTPPGKTTEGSIDTHRKYPPGSEDWDGPKKEKWDRNLEEAKERVRVKVRQREGATQEDEESAVRSVEGAAREGVPVERAERTVNRAIERDLSGEEIEKVTRAISYGADKNVDYEKLDTFIEKKIDSGERGDDLALSVYKEVDSGTMEKTEEKAEEKKTSWWKRVFKRN